MSKKRCEDCGRFMHLSDILPDEDEFDEDLAIECGLSEDDLADFVKIAPYHYVQDIWECDNCGTYEWHTEGKRYYFNPTSGNYDGEKPLTPKEQTATEHQRQELAGQRRMF